MAYEYETKNCKHCKYCVKTDNGLYCSHREGNPKVTSGGWCIDRQERCRRMSGIFIPDCTQEEIGEILMYARIGANNSMIGVHKHYISVEDTELPRWIPVSERLPNRDEYIKNNGLFNVSDGNRSYSEWFDIYDTQKFGEPTMNGFRVDCAVTAWQPLPEPYEKGGAE